MDGMHLRDSAANAWKRGNEPYPRINGFNQMHGADEG
jgi:hypothetical protein